MKDDVDEDVAFEEKKEARKQAILVSPFSLWQVVVVHPHDS